MSGFTKEKLEDIKQLLGTNLTFLRVLKSYCTDETSANHEIKDIIIALDEMLSRQKSGIDKLDELIKSC